MFIRNCLLCLASFLLSSPSIALPDDKEKPLQVVSDNVIVNYAEGITTLQGEVRVTQGSTTLNGNKVIIYTNKQRQLIKLIAYGDSNQQARYETLPTLKSSPFTATANTITYMGLEKLAIFEGEAHATDGINQFDGPKFKYWTEKQEVVTEKVANQRSTIIIYPGSNH
ncbi:MAG: lipopolysaccharide transport periplasmic protein LptA [Pseudomonadota bacterium]